MEKEEIEIFKVYADTRYNSNGALWEVSNLGNVRKNGEEYTPIEDGYGYLIFSKKHYYVHRAVAELFISNTLDKPTVDHINRIKTDNRVENLRWATMKEQAENRDNESIASFHRGRKRSNETRARISSSCIGRKLSDETRAKLSAARKGIKKSEETRKKMSAAQIGNKNVLGKIWIINPTTNETKFINKDELPDYLSQGYVRGRKIKHLCNA